MSSSLPIGWESRSNSMSEKDMKLGGIAATKFIDKSLSSSTTTEASTTNSNAYSGSTSGIYQNSHQVREHYLRQIEMQQQQQQDDSPFFSSNRHETSTTPMFWKERQQLRQLEAEGFRNQDTEKFTNNPSATFSGMVSTASPAQTTTSSTSSSKSGSSAHTALVKVATHTLESLADVLESNASGVEIPMQDRAAFAKAIQRAMQALASAKK